MKGCFSILLFLLTMAAGIYGVLLLFGAEKSDNTATISLVIAGIIICIWGYVQYKQDSAFEENEHPQPEPEPIPSRNETPNQTESYDPDTAGPERLTELKAIDRLDELIGLEEAKSEVKKLSSFVQLREWRKAEGLKTPTISYHCIFTGNPGTGKTTVARIIASIFKEFGIIKKGHLIETDRSGLVGEYLGQTAVKTNSIIDKALDGVLFIDEAYTLVNDKYGQEAIATMLKRMEDERDRLIVILAGYYDEMKHFIDSNPGLSSRFNRYIHFTDYNVEELWQIFILLTEKQDYKIDPEAEQHIKQLITAAIDSHDHNFGNARFVRNIFEKITEHQALRLARELKPDRGALQLITAADVEAIKQNMAVDC